MRTLTDLNTRAPETPSEPALSAFLMSNVGAPLDTTNATQAMLAWLNA